MSRPLLACICVLSGLLSGCSMARNFYDHQKREQQEFHDEWDVVGNEGRSEIPREKETDALTPMLESPQARAIKKNLGYE